MVKKQRQSADAEPSAAAAKKARTSQPGIAAALARGAPAAATELVLEQPRRRDLLDRRLTEELTSQGDKYLQAWSEKCYGLRDGSPGKGAAAATAVGGSSLKARRAAAAGYSKEDADLDAAGEAGGRGGKAAGASMPFSGCRVQGTTQGGPPVQQHLAAPSTHLPLLPPPPPTPRSRALHGRLPPPAAAGLQARRRL